MQVDKLIFKMDSQQEIGGAQALLQLGSKTKSDDENDENDEVEHSLDASQDGIKFTTTKSDEVHSDQEVANDPIQEGTEQENVMQDSKATNQQINDAVEAAVMRYVGGTLDEHQNGRKKRKVNHDDIMSNINEFNQWTGFLEDDIGANQEESFNSFHQQTQVPQQASPKQVRKRKKRTPHLTSLTHNEIDPELTGLDSNAEHDQLVQAAIMDARELAKQLSNSTLHHPENSSPSHGSLSNLPPHQAQQVLAAASAAVQGQGHPNTESLSTINQLAQAASSISETFGREQRMNRPSKSSKLSDGTGAYSDKQDEHLDKQKFNHLTSIDALVEEASNQACNWYNSLPHTNGSGPRMFSQEEIAAVDHFIAGYCHLHKITRQDICNRIWSNERKKDNFWESLTKVLPYRSRASVYKHVRRQYHVFEVRAKWTKQDDDLLRKLAATKEGNWKEIGSTMGRMPEDCRDRWRNYVKCGENRVLNKWSEEEERKLKEIITDMISNMSGDKKGPIINWTVVSERMNGVRSRIQCRYKWNKLIKRESAVRASYMNQETRLWLFQKLQRLGFPTVDSIDWNYIAHLYNEEHKPLNGKKNESQETWMATDFMVGFDRMKSEIKDHRKLSLAEVLDRLIEDYYIRQGEIPPRAQSQRNDKQDINALNHNVSLGLPGDHESPSYSSARPIHPVQGQVQDEDATSIANAAVAAVSASVNDDTHNQEYGIWR